MEVARGRESGFRLKWCGACSTQPRRDQLWLIYLSTNFSAMVARESSATVRRKKSESHMQCEEVGIAHAVRHMVET